MDIQISHLLSEGVPVDSKEKSCCGLDILVPSQGPFNNDLFDEVDDVQEEGASRFGPRVDLLDHLSQFTIKNFV